MVSSEKRGGPVASGHAGDAGPATLRLSNVVRRCDVLGPGSRFAIWVQGCGLHCPACMSPHTHDSEAGEVVAIEELADDVVNSADDGLSITGGEPFEQAEGIAVLLARVRHERPELTVVCYSGYRLEEIVTMGAPALAVLRSLDCLIDGRFDVNKAGQVPYRWRGSANQRVHLLSERVRDWAPLYRERGVHLEFEMDGEGVSWRGVPPPGFTRAFTTAVRDRGIGLSASITPDLQGEES